MKAVVKRFNKFSSYPLIVEAGWELTGSVFFSDLKDSEYNVGDIINVYFSETKEEWHYFRLGEEIKSKPKEGELV